MPVSWAPHRLRVHRLGSLGEVFAPAFPGVCWLLPAGGMTWPQGFLSVATPASPGGVRRGYL